MKETLPSFYMVDKIHTDKLKTRFLTRKLDEESKFRIEWVYSVYEIDRENHTINIILTDSHSYNDANDLIYKRND